MLLVLVMVAVVVMMTGDRYGGIVVVAIAVVQWNFVFFHACCISFFHLFITCFVVVYDCCTICLS